MKNGQFIGELIGFEGDHWKLQTTEKGKEYAQTIILIKASSEYDKDLRLKITKWPPFNDSGDTDWSKIIGEFTIGKKILAAGTFRNFGKYDNLEFVVKELTVL